MVFQMNVNNSFVKRRIVTYFYKGIVRGGVNGGAGCFCVAVAQQGKYAERYHFLHDFELEGFDAPLRTEMVGGDDEAVFQQGNAPADQDNLPQRQWRGGGFDVPIPRKRHDEIGQGEQGDDDEDMHRNALATKSEGEMV